MHSTAVQVDEGVAADYSRSPTLKESYGDWRLCCTFALAASGLLVVGVPGLYLLLWKRPATPVRDRPGFCCRLEAETIIPLLNRSVDPCHDFYEYVCTRPAVEASQRFGIPWSKQQIWKHTELIHRALIHGPVGRFQRRLLEGYFREAQRVGSVSSYVEAILQTGTVSASMGPAQIARFLVEMSMKYSVPGVIFMNVSSDVPAAKTLILQRLTSCLFSAPQEEIAAALRTFNSALNVSLYVDSLFEFDRIVSNLHHFEDPRTERASVENTPFSALLKADWVALIKEYVLEIEPRVTTTLQAMEERLDALFSALASAANQPLAVAYVTLCTAVNVDDSVRLTIQEASFFPVLNFACNVIRVCELDEAFESEVVSSAETNRRLRGLFAGLRNDVITEVSSWPRSVTVSDGTSMMSALRQVRLMLPHDITVSDVPLPEALLTASFASVLFAARAYKFRVLRAKVQRRIPSHDAIAGPTVTRFNNRLFIPASLFFPATLHEPAAKHLLDFATVGFEMTTQLWLFLLESKRWSNATLSSLLSRHACLKDSSDKLGNATDKKLIGLALGLVAAAKLAQTTPWFVPYRVSSMRLSHAKMFYLIWAYNQCSPWRNQLNGLDVQALLIHLRTFIEAFDCPETYNSRGDYCDNI